jgi:hypothetical protein
MTGNAADSAQFRSAVAKRSQRDVIQDMKREIDEFRRKTPATGLTKDLPSNTFHRGKSEEHCA